MTAEFGQINAGQVIDGKYRITRLLGTGGMGAVFEGENMRIRRRVAIKMLHPSVSTQQDVVMRFEKEATAAGRIGSEHICEVYDLGTLADGTRYMVMEYLDGETLSARIKRNGRLTPAMSIPLLVQVLEALGAAHAAGIIHRDLKPDNIFILPQRGGIRDFVKILDFGVSKFSQLSGDEMNVTRAGAVVGTPYYMSPEQARGTSNVDARTDVYAIGVLLYQASTGQVPYQAETFNELLFKIVLEVAPPPQTYVPDIDPEFSGIIQRAMGRDPSQRFQSCAEFRDALLSFQARAALPPAPPPGARASFPHPPPTQVLPIFDMATGPLPMGASVGGPFPAGHVPPGSPVGPVPPASPTQSGSWASASGTSPQATNTGPSWAASSSPSAVPPVPGAAATANSWGNASGTATIPKSKAPLMIGILAAVLVIAGGAAGSFLFLGKKGPTKTELAAGVETAAPTVNTVTAPTAPPTAASAAPTATETVAAEPSSAPTTSATVAVAVPTVKLGRPKTTASPATSAKANTGKTVKPGGGNDLGY